MSSRPAIDFGRRHAENPAQPTPVDVFLVTAAPLPMLDEAWNISPFTQLGHVQRQRPQSRIPTPFPMPIAVRGPLCAPLMRLGTDLGSHLRLHQEVRNYLRHGT